MSDSDAKRVTMAAIRPARSSLNRRWYTWMITGAFSASAALKTESTVSRLATLKAATARFSARACGRMSLNVTRGMGFLISRPQG